MFNVKSIATGAAIGFIVSFFIGLFSPVVFWVVILRALIFAVAGAGIGFGIHFIFGKFLSEGSASSSADLSISDTPSEKKVAGVVDITVSDERLDEDVGGPKFVVDSGKTLGGEEKKAGAAPATPLVDEADSPMESPASLEVPPSASPAPQSAAPSSSPAPSSGQPLAPSVSPSPSAEASGFTPVNMAQTAPKVDSATMEENPRAEEASEGAGEANPKAASSGGEDVANVLDDLPDIGDIALDSKKDEESDIIEDSEFASGGEPEKEAVAFPNGQSVENKDTNEMAMAIRTLLAKDK